MKLLLIQGANLNFHKIMVNYLIFISQHQILRKPADTQQIRLHKLLWNLSGT